MLNVVAARTPWSRRIFVEDIEPLPGQWIFVETAEELSGVVGGNSQIERIYFLHWSEKVPAAITARYECINFHMTDLPFGRGGSPLQNLISLGHEETVLCALKMTDDLDAGPIYMKRRLPLHGSAEAIYARAGRVAAQMIEEIHSAPHKPVAQDGVVHPFVRRRPEHSELPSDLGLSSTYDFIRMLDAPGYPHAFLVHGNLHMDFRRAVIYSDSIVADVTISERTEQTQ